MKLAFSTNAFRRHQLLEAIDLIERIGFSGVEIMCDIPHAYPPDTDAVQRVMLKNHVSRKGLEFSNLNAFMLYALGDTYHPSFIEKDESMRRKRIEYTLSCIDLAAELEAPSISIEPGGPVLHVSRNWAIGAFREAMDEISKKAEQRGIYVLVEPEPDLLIETSRQFVEFMELVSSPVIGLNFDIGHFYCVGEDPAEVLESLADYIKHYHLEDIAATRKHHHLIPGEGVIDFERVLTAIANSKYSGYITIELYPYEADPLRAAKAAYDFVSPLIEQLVGE